MNADIYNWLIENRGHIIDVTKPIVERFTQLLSEEDTVFHSEISSEFSKMIREVISNEITKALGSDALSISEVLEDLDLETYLKE